MTYRGYHRIKSASCLISIDQAIELCPRNQRDDKVFHPDRQDSKNIFAIDNIESESTGLAVVKTKPDVQITLANPMFKASNEKFCFSFIRIVNITTLMDPVYNPSIRILQEKLSHLVQTYLDSTTCKKVCIDYPSKEPISIEARAPSEEFTPKRYRSAIKLQEKIEIINFWEQHKSMSIIQISEHFGHPRTTIHGVLKKKDILLSVSKHQPQSSNIPAACRIVETRFRILEELLAAWLHKLKADGVIVSNKKITTQAFEIHRMLSGLLREPLPPCLFTSGWLKGFRKRRGLNPILTSCTRTKSCKFDITDSELNIQEYKKSNIYVCDMTSMFLGLMPVNVFQNMEALKTTSRHDRYSASVLLCCDATGKDKLDPLVFVRQNEGVFVAEGYDGITLDHSTEDATKASIENWLDELDEKLNRDVLLFVDIDMWKLLGLDRKKTTFLWKRIQLHKLQGLRSGMMPLSAEIMKEFKANYHTLLIERWRNGMKQSKDIENMMSTEAQLKLLPEAWQMVHCSTVTNCFQRLYSAYDSLSEGHQSNTTRTHVETKLTQALKSAFPTVPETVLQYYLIQDKDTGPSSFLRAKISELQRNCDFEMCFDTK
ncbi:hypothetical protein BGZ49_008272 [Haplosporangium sp. Z 27]|nr:hypothetical protein BGZ49_008272 [Haplosporangium sp. Z 27]